MLENLLLSIEQYSPDSDLNLVVKAYNLAERAHEGQYRKSGERYLVHPVSVAKILIELQMDSSTIVAALLHDVVEDTVYSYEDIKKIFGKEIADLVDGVTKLSKIEYKTKEETQAENLRKMFIAMAKDIRVVLIKLADRLHNMRTLNYMSELKAKEKARETLEIYCPIANRLGISKIKFELEDLALRYLDPEGYYDLVEKVSKKKKEREAYITQVVDTLKSKFSDSSQLQFELSGRAKHFYSIYRKMHFQGKNFEEIYDLTGIRIIVKSIRDCYEALGIVHTIWKPIPGRFKDYIAMPKPNMYQSLHTTVIGPDGGPLEVQIRTIDMHRTAEYGIAAHWKYKEGIKNDDKTDIDQKLAWLRQMMEWQKDLNDPREFMEALKMDLFTNQVFVFTPKGDIIELPSGATPLDFAYKVHTAVGNKCTGAKVDARIVPIDYKLKNGNIIEIITSSNAKPSRDWLNIVKSSHAKNKIRQWFKKENREDNIEKGKELLEKEIRRQGLNFSEIANHKNIQSVVKSLNYSSEEDLYAAIGYEGITISAIISKLKTKIQQDKLQQKLLEPRITDPEVQKTPEQNKFKEKKRSQGILIRGVDNILVRFSKCCNPLPGDDIVGFITKGRGVSIHRSDCPNVISESDEFNGRFLEVEWDIDKQAAFEAEIQIKAEDKRGMLTDITQILSTEKIPLIGINARTNKNKIANMTLTVEVNSTQQLNFLINKIRSLSGVLDIFRVLN